MDFVFEDFNDAGAHYSGQGAEEWADIDGMIRRLPLYFQASQQEGKGGTPIFDPKATNAFLTAEAVAHGWRQIPMPADWPEFGKDWDGGKGASLAEWQFSNYPFLWNNVMRTEAVYKSGIRLQGLQPILGLIVVTKSGVFPSSNSTLYYEQARAQVHTVTKFGAFTIPIRLVGLTIPPGTATVDVTWSDYPSRYSRNADRQAVKRMAVRWKRPGKYGSPAASFTET